MNYKKLKIKEIIRIALERLERFAPVDEEAKLDFDVEMASVEHKLNKHFNELLTPTVNVEEIKKEYWEKVYQTVDPFRKKTAKKPIDEFVVYMDKESFEDFWQFFLPYLSRNSQSGGEDVERLSEKFHEIYQMEAKRQGDIRHEDSYTDLPENIKEFDRVLARYVLNNYLPKQENK